MKITGTRRATAALGCIACRPMQTLHVARSGEEQWKSIVVRSLLFAVTPGLCHLSVFVPLPRAEDPTHVATMVGRYVRGLQSKGLEPQQGNRSEILLAGSITKHWMVYNLDNTSTTDRYAFNAMVTAHDVADTYRVLWEAVVAEDPAVGVMCSYNAVGSLQTANNPASSPVPVCTNRYLFETVLGRGINSTHFAREESIVVSDGNAIQDVFSYHGFPKSGAEGGTIGESVVASVQAGTDMNLGETLS